MEKAKLFYSENNQAVLLPKGYHFDGEEVYIKKAGKAVILLPYHELWHTTIESLDEFSTDYMQDREQPLVQDRLDVLD